MNPVAVSCFALILAATVGITIWAARRTKSAADFYTAGGDVSALQNGLALAGDSLSAGAFLGLCGLVFTYGFHGFAYAVGYSTGMPIVVFLLADRLRRAGRYTFIDATCVRLSERPMRIFGATASLLIVCFYLVAQMVGAGQLIHLLFGLPNAPAVMLVGVLMIIYVLFGGMTATTWVQIVKAVLMLGIGLTLAVLVLARFDFDFPRLLEAAAQTRNGGPSLFSAAKAAASPPAAISLALGLMFGTAGLPHVLMRFFTVPDARAARTSVLWATGFINLFYALIAVLGFGAVAILAHDPSAVTANGSVIGGSNMAAVHLSRVLGGQAMLGFVSAVAFATILAVVAGLTLAGASAVSHDLYARVWRRGQASPSEELFVSRLAAIGLGVAAVLLGCVFQGQNIAYMISLAFAAAASSTFPVLVLALYWRGLTTSGAILGGASGLIGTLFLTALGPSVWVEVLGFKTAVVQLEPPTLITMPLAFAICWLVSSLQPSGHRRTSPALAADPSEAIPSPAER